MASPDQSVTVLALRHAPRGVHRYTWVGCALLAVTAVIDITLGRHATLIGFLIAGPCATMLTSRTRPTIAVSLCAVGLAVGLGAPDGIWMTFPHVMFISAVSLVAASNIAAAAFMQHHAAGNHPTATAGLSKPSRQHPG